MKIYYHPFSFPSLGAVFTAEAMGLEHERKVVDLQNDEQKSPEYRAINPFGKVPAIQDGDFRLAESGAIMRYMARKQASPLYPDDITGQAQVDQWMDYCNHHIRMPVGKVQFNRVLAPMFGVEPDERSLADGLQFLENNLPVVEARLSKNQYLYGDFLSLADIALVSALEPVEMAQIDLSPYPSLTNWLKKQRKADYYTRVHTHFGAELGL